MERNRRGEQIQGKRQRGTDTVKETECKGQSRREIEDQKQMCERHRARVSTREIESKGRVGKVEGEIKRKTQIKGTVA